MLAKLSDLKARLDISDGSSDALLTALLTSMTAAAARYCNRGLEYVAAGLTELHDGGCPTLWLRSWPIVAFTSVKEAGDYDFASAAALTENTDFRAVRSRGRLIRLPEESAWLEGTETIEVKYTAGWNDPAAASVPGVDYPPGHVQEAILLQAADLWRRKSEPGYAKTFGVGGVAGGFATPIDWLPLAKELLDPERRL
jgi:hypothetical protein